MTCRQDPALALHASVGATTLVTAQQGTITVSAQVDGSFEVTTGRSASGPVFVCVDLNRSSFDRLQEIVHIDPDRAEQIVALRAAQPFGSVEQLSRVDGIGPARVSDILAQALACVD